MFRTVLIAKPGRDRQPDRAHLACHGHPRRRRLFGCRPLHARRAGGGRGPSPRPRPRRPELSGCGAVIAAAKASGAEAVHPGYGFLSENVAFAERLAAEGIAFIGPKPEHLRAFGLKHTARELAQASGVPLLPGTGLIDSGMRRWRRPRPFLSRLLKSTAGGGGIGCSSAPMRRSWPQPSSACSAPPALPSAMPASIWSASWRRPPCGGADLRQRACRVVALGERDCSLQRRNQKVIEETPAPLLPDAVRTRLHAAAVALGESVDYASAGTVEFIYDPAREEFYFLEVNTRLQVEHPVTEAVFGIDLVEWMVRQAAGEDPIPATPLTPKGAAIEARVYAEIPHAQFPAERGPAHGSRLPGRDTRGWMGRRPAARSRLFTTPCWRKSSSPAPTALPHSGR